MLQPSIAPVETAAVQSAQTVMFPFAANMLIAFLLLVVAVFLTVIRFHKNKYANARLMAVTVLTVLSVAVMRMPLYLDRGESRMDSTVHSVVVGIQTVSLGGDLDGAIDDGIELIDGVERDTISAASSESKFYASFCIAQYALCPFLCAFALIKAISSMLGRFWVRWFHRGPVFFFSELTDDSIQLAGSIQHTLHANGVKGFLCFAAVTDQTDAGLLSNLHAAELKNVLLYHNGIGYNMLPRRSSAVNCILCHPNEQNNLNELMQLLHDGENTRETKRSFRYFVFAESRHAEQVVDSLSNKYITENGQNRILCMLNTRENIAVHILDRHPLFNYTVPCEDGRERLDVLIAGNTTLADHILRNAYPCAQLKNCDLRITIADTNAEERRSSLYRSSPMLQKNEQLVEECGKLCFHSLSDPMAIADDALLKDKQYIVLAFGDDKQNIQAARNIRMQIERQRLTDKARAGQRVAIIYIVEDTLLNDVCVESDANLDNGISLTEMLPEGSRRMQNSTEVLFGHELLRKAFFINCAYRGAKMQPETPAELQLLEKDFVAFMNSSYNRRSSVAAALQIKYRHHVLAHSASKADAERLLAYTEHYRWCAYAMMDGFELPAQEQLEGYFYTGNNTHRSNALRLHPCLVSTRLEAEDSPWLPDGDKDDLDRLSLQVHEMLKQRLRELFSNDERLLQKLETYASTGDRAVRQELLDLLDQLPDAEKKLPVKMVKGMFNDFKESDRNIVHMTGDILAASMNDKATAALSLFWLAHK